MYPTNNYNQNQPTNDQQPVADWFNSIEPPIGMSPLPGPENKPASHRKLLIVSLCLLTIILLGGGLLALLIRPSSTIAGICFEQSDYTNLTTKLSSDDSVVPAEDLRPNENFYTQSVYFTDGTSQYSEATKTNTEQLISTVGSFYKDHAARSPLSVTLSSGYPSGESPEIASQRLNAVRNALQKSGVASSAITTKEPSPVTAQDDYVTDGLPVLVSLAPLAQCQ